MGARKSRLTNPTKYSEVFDTAASLGSRSRQGLHKLLDVKIIERKLYTTTSKTEKLLYLWSPKDAFP